MNKQTTLRAVAQKTGLSYFQVQLMLEALIAVWSEELTSGGHIALENFLTIRVTTLKTHRRGKLRNYTGATPMQEHAYRVDTRLSKRLKHKLRYQR